MRRIVILPIFNEAHFLPYFLKNVEEIIEPEMIVFNEGCFPRGPENRSNLDEEFLETYTRDGKRSFDIEETKDILSSFKGSVEIVLNEMEYGNCSTQEAYIRAFTEGIPEGLGPSDVILQTEADVFIHQDDKEKLHRLLSELPPGRVLTAVFKRFFISPYVLMHPEKERRIAVRWGDGTLHKKVASDNFLDHYVDRYAILSDLRVFHYEWIRPGKYYAARRAQFSGARPAALMHWHDMVRLHILRGEDVDTFSPLRLRTDRSVDHPIHFRDHPEYQRFASTHLRTDG